MNFLLEYSRTQIVENGWNEKYIKDKEQLSRSMEKGVGNQYVL